MGEIEAFVFPNNHFFGDPLSRIADQRYLFGYLNSLWQIKSLRSFNHKLSSLLGTFFATFATQDLKIG